MWFFAVLFGWLGTVCTSGVLLRTSNRKTSVESTMLFENEESLDKLWRKICDKIESCKNELKNEIKASEARVILEIENIKARLNKLEKENSELANRVEAIEKQNKKKNILVFGLVRQEEIDIKKVCEEINRSLGTNITEKDISDFFYLGNKEKSPLKLEFVSYNTKRDIFKNIKALKGTKLVIANDLTSKQQTEQKILRKHLALARQNNSTNSYIRGSKLYINYKPYSVEELERNEFEEVENLRPRPGSAPGTPTSSHKLNNEERKTIADNTVLPEGKPGPSSTPKEQEIVKPAVKNQATKNPVSQFKTRTRSTNKQ